MERRKESTGSPLAQQIVGTDRIPAPMMIDTPKIADKPRKGLPSFIWVIGTLFQYTYTYYMYIQNDLEQTKILNNVFLI